MRLLKLPLALAATVAALAPISPASAQDVQPIVNVLQIPRDANGIRIAVRNPRTVDAPFSFEVFERTVNPDGSEVQTPADDLFTVYPVQVVVRPGATQAIKVQWLGGPVNKSRSFTLYASEVPVDLANSGQSGVQRLLRVGASIHVTPPNVKPLPVLESAVADGDGTKVTIRNDGDRFFYIDDLELAFGDKSIGGVQLGQTAGRTLVPPGARRTFTIKGFQGQPTLKLITRS